ncbi:MAG TPA: DEAD/DEAH box helicase [Candidatus Lumbricidophila sp.]|nr:DEAD/DEAH box helicase [Candidatus Lumbricidophila sp.]
MPKNKKPAGGRPAKNFDPNRGAAKAGSRSPGHRGFRTESSDGPRKPRWNSDERAARTEGGAYSRPAGDRAPRSFDRDDRAPRSFDRGDRPARSFDRPVGDRPARTFDRDGGPRRFGSDDRAPRSFDRGDRPARTFDRDDRAPRSFDRGDRPARTFDRPVGDRPARTFDRDGGPRRFGSDDRAPRSFDRGDRPARTFDRDSAPRTFDRGDRPARTFDRDGGPRRFGSDDRAPRSFDRGDRPARTFDRDSAPRTFDRGDRPARTFDRDSRPPRTFDRDARPARSFDGDRPARTFDRDSAPRSFDRGDRPARTFDRDARPPRTFDRDARPARSFDGDRPARTFDRDARPPRTFDRDVRPARSFDRDDRAPRRDFGDRDRAPRRDFGDRPGFQQSDRRDSSFYPSKDARAQQVDDVVLERIEASAIQAGDVDGVTFGDLGLGQGVVRALAELGADAPFPIQAATIPMVLAARDVLGRGRTGSGKTIAFGAPTVERLMRLWAEGGKSGGKRQSGRAPRALILAPTRELALQIDRTVQPIAQAVGLFTTQIYGGVPQARQVGALQRGVDIVIGTPGRIEDLIQQGYLDLSNIAITVLDEADHMCDLGFLEPVQRLLRATPEGSQRLLFSATLDTGVAALVDEFLTDPAVHEVAGEDQASGTIDHRVLVIDNRDKRDIVAQLADRDGRTLVFARTRAFAEDLALHLEDAGIRAVALHGDLNQSRRTRNLALLTSGRVQVLVATDVAARGIHVDDIDLVIQADAPDEYKTYLHRSGRTGRAGRMGRVVTLVPNNRQRRLNDLLGRAEIDVDFEHARLGDVLIDEIANGEVELEAPVASYESDTPVAAGDETAAAAAGAADASADAGPESAADTDSDTTAS